MVIDKKRKCLLSLNGGLIPEVRIMLLDTQRQAALGEPYVCINYQDNTIFTQLFLSNKNYPHSLEEIEAFASKERKRTQQYWVI